MPEIVSLAGCIVVTDDASRVRWQRSGTVLNYAGTWPSSHERTALVRRLRNGTNALVVVPMVNPTVDALRDGVTFTASDSSELTADDLIEIPVPVLDWMPTRLRLVGHYQRRAVATEMARVPAVLRPPIVVRSGSRHVKFAIRTGGTAAIPDAALVELADFIFGTSRAQPQSRSGRTELAHAR
jgi:hypothetical protein